ncbi:MULTISPECIES: flagellar biosynthesis protein FliQ [Caldanaerobacter]|uniref:Flagellar biosynthetic protein FliQ n=4 Tax=Caldanaerobacter subterraneus TaxID=911092 RepID=Q8RA05_CALS4|nr:MULTISPECIES: flagellar biosynthesis protein FliQ [Caldanaerobacter]AAM24647.1 Flagellar biosynthesis/type III secretory pathway protein [Caldanaerobacter subterraneus subsp. tengcongensis MB4]ERM92303.1 flagellar biosynthesis protein FliQ [Caldanaerobacter subterraneus subsp. yonseiensis KB-1]MBE3579251.1 flagellar biosynthesis protein FliQ [Caldanaerobacter subterraneus]MCS3915791.1 flagellar biosynthetic protein FliQ [Caldanaerobacter subterraneus subsp. tengcongensis MB4]NNG66668.1 flag
MSSSMAVDLGREALSVALTVATPMLAVALGVGLLISIFQATTQIQEQTLSFVPKIVAVLLSLILFGPWMLTTLVNYTQRLFLNINNFIK